MQQKRYALGLDFGTESVRCLAVDFDSGKEKAVAVYEYPDGVISHQLPKTSVSLGDGWALQNPQNWLDGMREVVHQVIQQGEIDSASIMSLGVCFTSCTILSTTENGIPLCFLNQWESEPHAWPKLWKHHAAQTEASLINELACNEEEHWLKRYGGMISAEWLFPKTLQVHKESPECFEATQRFIEGGDWIVWKLVGKEMRSVCQAGYKALWHSKEGYPSLQFLEKLGKGFGSILTKLGNEHFPIGTRAGGLTVEMASELRLSPGTPVATAIIDAHSAVLASGVATQGRMVMVMGTSSCHLVMDEKEIFTEGIAGVVRDGILPGYFAYEAGQSAVGDIFAWVGRQGIPENYCNEAKEMGISTHDLLMIKSVNQKPGEHGLIALDWLNGTRSILMDANLSGVLVGLTLDTNPEDIYRAMIEATAFGTRVIIETYENSGISIEEIYACGGLVQNSMLLQIYSDITERTIKVSSSSQTAALGAAILGVMSVDSKSGTSHSYRDVISRMTKSPRAVYNPNLENQKTYQKLFKKYILLHDYFGREKPSLMKDLKFHHD